MVSMKNIQNFELKDHLSSLIRNELIKCPTGNQSKYITNKQILTSSMNFKF